MRDIPVFTTANGAASLILKQIPYWGNAYIRLQDTLDPQALLAECKDFCRCAGAERIYAAGHPYLERYPVYSRILRMVCQRQSIADTDAALMPVLPENLEQWQRLYNRRMQDVPNAAYMTLSDAREMLDKGTGYFIHRGDTLLGIGIAGGGQIDCVVSLVPGAGTDVVQALCNAVFSDAISLEVASTNTRAVRLYNKLGFITTGEMSAWYEIL